MEQLIKKIEAEKERIDKEMSTSDGKTEFYSKFLIENKFITIGDLKDINSCELAIAIIAQSEEVEDINELKSIVYKNRVIFEDLENKNIESIKLIISKAKDDGYFQFLRTALKTKKNFNPFSEEGRLINKIKLSLKTMKISPENFSEFMDLSQDCPKLLDDALTIVLLQKELEKAIKRNKEYEKISLQLVAKQKNNENMLYSEMKLVSAVTTIVNALGEIKWNHDKRQKAERVKQNTLSEEKQAYEKLKTKLEEALKNGEIQNIDSIINKDNLSPSIRKQVLEIIYNHNNEIYSKMTDEYTNLTSKDDSKYRVILLEYGINPDDSQLDIIMKNSLEDLTTMLETLKSMKITKPEQIMNIISYSDAQIINNYASLIEREIISSEFLQSNPSVFLPKTKEYYDFVNNLAFIQENKINPRILSSNEEIFITPHEVLSRNIKTIKEYDLLNLLKTVTDSTFLASDDLSKSIDILLELGYEKSLEESLDILNHKDKFMRLQVLKVLNIPLSSSEELNEALTTTKFFLPESALEKYLYNAVDYNILEVESTEVSVSSNLTELDKLIAFDNTSRTYNIDGVLISKNKVKRNLENISPVVPKTDKLIYSVIKDSLLSDDEYDKVVRKLTSEKSSSTTK